MFRAEAQWVGDWLAAQHAAALSPVLNVGSGDAVARRAEHPWIDALIFEPLAARGVALIHNDIVPGAGVDVVGDVLTEAGFAALTARAPRTVLLNNVLEHVEGPERLLARFLDLLPSGGRVVVGVPYSYPPHHCPIDTGLRPTPAEIAALAPEATLVDHAVLSAEWHWHEVARNPRKLSRKKAPWLFKPYRQSLAVLRKP